MTVVIVYKTNYELKVKCESYEITKNGYGHIVNIEFEGITENQPILSNIDDVLCIYRVISDEVK